MTERHGNNPIDTRVRMVRSQVFFGHATGNMASILIGWVLLTWVLHSGGVEAATLRVWGGLLVATALIVSLYDRKIAREGVTDENHEQRVRTRILLGVAITIFYGVAGFLLPEGADNKVPDTFLFIILSAVMTIAVLSYAVMPLHYLLLDLASLAPLTLLYGLRYLHTDDSYYLILLALVVTWQALVLRKALSVARTVIDGITLNERLQQEVKEHEQTRESIRHMAMHDYLTGLANRRQFEETAERMVKVAGRDGAKLGLLAIDLDKFKPVNDRFGHATGDALLRAVADRLRETLRSSDFAARMGGDEFSVIVHSVEELMDVHGVVTKVSDALCIPFVADRQIIAVGASVGWAIFPDDGVTTGELLRVADRRMYADKQQRRSPVRRVATPSSAVQKAGLP